MKVMKLLFMVKSWPIEVCMMKLTREAREEPGNESGSERQRGAGLSLEPQTDTRVTLAAVSDAYRL